MRILDLFCGEGGAAAGLAEAWPDAEILGVDYRAAAAAYYPFDFVAADVMDFLGSKEVLDRYDFVWASPPCQLWSTAGRGRHDGHVDLVTPVRAALAGHRAWVIENVRGAPIRPDIRLTGPMVGLPRITRLKHFELSMPLVEKLLFSWSQPPPIRSRHPERLTVTSSLGEINSFYRRKAAGLRGRYSKEEAMVVMGISHPMTIYGISQAVPPPYARYIASIISLLS